MSQNQKLTLEWAKILFCLSECELMDFKTQHIPICSIVQLNELSKHQQRQISTHDVS